MNTNFRRLFLFLSYTFVINTCNVINASVLDTITKIDSIQKPKSFLLENIDYEATDTVLIDPKNRSIRLYNNAKIFYEDMQIESGIIVVNYEKNEIYAGRIKDSLGEYSQFPIFKQGQDEVRPDSLRYNMDSKKAIIFKSRTEESGLNIISDKTKKENDSVYYIWIAQNLQHQKILMIQSTIFYLEKLKLSLEKKLLLDQLTCILQMCQRQ